MDLRSIKTFRTIVKHKSFQKAAEELAYAQSTITMQMKKLEQELGVLLIERGKNFQLTEAGRLLNAKGEVLLKDYDILQELMADFIHGESGDIRIGVMEPTASYRMPHVLTPFYEKFPKVNVNIQIQSSRALVEMVKKGEIDLAICTAPDEISTLHFSPLFTEDVALLMQNSHPLANRESVRLEDIEDEMILITTAICPFRRNLEKQMIDKGLKPKYRMEISNMLALKHYVELGYGLAAVPIIAASPPPPGTVLKPLQDFQKELTVGLMRNEEKSYTGNAMTYLIDLFYKELKHQDESLQKK
ncbi:LysR family transcriptional regulator [Alkalicoccobacillus porphyridii]|uniref:LysR family transcriptional regulator n=1 Tax=Alkalicoccobacillus porphyridii TaxID=2597270 RepID=A0A554A2D5_9BACI|nr:LysR family transcriptional regulator [Alkalicoccobacillus porphyridii]TSB47852.1 LysR family transcriptional regulator [Alkalicoccobacillus porphyridii]